MRHRARETARGDACRHTVHSDADPDNSAEEAMRSTAERPARDVRGASQRLCCRLVGRGDRLCGRVDASDRPRSASKRAKRRSAKGDAARPASGLEASARRARHHGKRIDAHRTRTCAPRGKLMVERFESIALTTRPERRITDERFPASRRVRVRRSVATHLRCKLQRTAASGRGQRQASAQSTAERARSQQREALSQSPAASSQLRQRRLRTRTLL